MADSGLETESIASLQEIASNNSSINLDETSESTISKKCDEILNTSVNPCTTIEHKLCEQDLASAGIVEKIHEEISDSKKSIIKDRFYEFNDESNQEANSYTPTLHSDYGSTLPQIHKNSIKNDDEMFTLDKICLHGKKTNLQWQHNDLNNLSASSSCSNYYFIDASSLNDDLNEPSITTPTTSTTKAITTTSANNLSKNLNNPDVNNIKNLAVWSSSVSSSGTAAYNAITVQTSIDTLLNDVTINEKTMNQQNECKVLKHSESLVDTNSVVGKSLDCHNQIVTSKESLAVEIKEADSGESAQHSPCPDNNTKTDGMRNAQKSTLIGEKTTREMSQESSERPEQKKSSLIRRNTFELDANDESLSSLRQEYERRQGTLVFQNSITQYSQHRIDGDPYFDDKQLEPGLAPASLPSEPLRAFDDNCYKSMARSASDKLLLRDLLLQPQPDPLDPVDCPFTSLPVNINEQLNGPPCSSPLNSRLRKNEAVPIVSGGSSGTDFQKPTESPSVRRRTESTPIVSGGLRHIPDVVPQRHKLRSSASAHSTTVWVVDMSDCQSNGGHVSSNNSSSESSSSCSRSSSHKQHSSTSSRKFGKSTKEWSAEKDKQPSSLGYFVNLDELKDPSENSKSSSTSYKHRRRPSDTVSEKSYCEFFVDMSDAQQQEKRKPAPVTRAAIPVHSASVDSSVSSDAKKNIFSMFIDFNEPTAGNTGRSNSFGSKFSPPARDKARIKRESDEPQLEKKTSPQQAQCVEEQAILEKKPKSSVFMFIESDSPVVRRRTLSSSRPAFKRHSWNTDKSNESNVTSQTSQQSQSQQITSSSTIISQQQNSTKKMHKRAHSLSIDRLGNGSNYFHPLAEAANKLEQGQQQQQQQQQQTEIETEYDFRDTPPNSHVEIVNHEEVLLSLKSRNYQELDSIHELTTDEAKRKTTDNQPVNHQDECCSESCTETRKSETFDVSSSVSNPSSNGDNACDLNVDDLLDIKLQNTMIKTTIQDNKSNSRLNNKTAIKSVNSRSIPLANFVRLSDLDKRSTTLNNSSAYLTSVSSRDSSQRVSNNNSTGTSSWNESKSNVSARMSEPLYKALTKKFPLIVSVTKSENLDDFNAINDNEAVISESDMSSLQSSMGRSGQGSTEETETSTSFVLGIRPYNRLGEDLLRMFLEEINPDVTVDVGGRRIRAHKCILSSRCQYFAAILSGSWVENSGNIISLQGYSYNAVHFALRHIYSGESCIPDTISIVELATLADMLCLEGLKEVIALTLKIKYCHLFHKPCTGCSVGVLECMPLAAAYGLDEVYRKSLRWVTRYFVRIWPSKEFATLPRELMDKCYFQHIVHMSIDNVLQTIMDCDKLLTTLPNVRWAEPVFRLVSNLVDASMKYLTDNFASVLGSESFQSLDKEATWNIGRLEDHLLAAAERLPPEQACKSYSRLDKMFICRQADDVQRIKPKWSSLFVDLMEKIKVQVEKCLVRDAARAARTSSWLKMDLELRRRIQELACLVILPSDISNKRPSRHSNFLKEPKERQEARIMSSSRTPPNRNFDFRKMKMAISEHNDRTLKQTPLLQTRKIMNNKPKTDPLQRKLSNDKLENDLASSFSRPKSWPNKIEVKSRYLEPRTRLPTKENTPQVPEKSLSQQRKKIIISSSDSSRTSSPAMKRAACERRVQSKITKVPIKKDGKALSSDSLTGSNSRLVPKKEVASKSLGITRPESPSLKAKDIEAGLSIDSLAENKRITQVQQNLLQKTSKMDTSISTDSLMTDTTTITTPRSVSTNSVKSSPILGKTTSVNQLRNYEKLKRSPPVQQRYNTSTTNNNSNNTNNNQSLRRPMRSLDASTAASRSRAAAVASAYHGSLNLRKSLLDAAKAPDIPNKTISPAMTRSNLRQSTMSTRSSSSTCTVSSTLSRTSDKRDETFGNQRNSGSSPNSKRSPKSNVNSRLNKSTMLTTNRQKANKLQEDKAVALSKLKSQTSSTTATTTTADQNGPKFLNQSSRSGTFLKDEPTILNKSDIETAAIDV